MVLMNWKKKIQQIGRARWIYTFSSSTETKIFLYNSCSLALALLFFRNHGFRRQGGGGGRTSSCPHRDASFSVSYALNLSTICFVSWTHKSCSQTCNVYFRVKGWSTCIVCFSNFHCLVRLAVSLSEIPHVFLLSMNHLLTSKALGLYVKNYHITSAMIITCTI